MIRTAICTSIICLGLSAAATAAPEENAIIKFAIWAIALGNAEACGVDTSAQFQRVDAWFKREWKGRELEGSHHHLHFLAMKRSSFDEQRDGKSPYTCEQAQAMFDNAQWP